MTAFGFEPDRQFGFQLSTGPKTRKYPVCFNRIGSHVGMNLFIQFLGPLVGTCGQIRQKKTHKFDSGNVVVIRAGDVADPPHEAVLGTVVRQPHHPVVHAHLDRNQDDS